MTADPDRPQFRVVGDAHIEGSKESELSGRSPHDLDWDNAVGGREFGEDELFVYHPNGNENLNQNTVSFRPTDLQSTIIDQLTGIKSGTPWRTKGSFLRSAVQFFVRAIEAGNVVKVPADIVSAMALDRVIEAGARAEYLHTRGREAVEDVRKKLGTMFNSPGPNRDRYLRDIADEADLFPDEYRNEIIELLRREGVNINEITDGPDPRENHYLQAPKGGWHP